MRFSVPASQAGPFDLWPTGLGFDYFYGLDCQSGTLWFLPYQAVA